MNFRDFINEKMNLVAGEVYLQMIMKETKNAELKKKIEELIVYMRDLDEKGCK